MTEELLTDDEKLALKLSGDLANVGFRIIQAGGGPTVEADLGEWAMRVHAIQHMILAQAGARAYPTEYRLLGGLSAGKEPVDDDGS